MVNDMAKVLHINKDKISKDDVYIGRGSIYGNPYEIGKDGTRKEVIDKYEIYLYNNKELLEIVKNELKGKNLVCFCKPKKCHGDILLRIANDDFELW